MTKDRSSTPAQRDSSNYIAAMVDRFLGWKLPDDFHPDGGISFTQYFNVEYNAKRGLPPARHDPIGTNLLNADQAKAMLEYVVLPVIEASAAVAAADREPYGYVWFNKRMEQRFTRRLPHPQSNEQPVGDVTPVYTRTIQSEMTSRKRRLLNTDGHCPSCGHNRNTSSVSSIDNDDGTHYCQKCSAEWEEIA